MSEITDRPEQPTEETLIQARLSHWMTEKERLEKEIAEAKFNVKKYEKLLRDYNEFKQSIK